MDANPILVELTRGGRVESFCRGAFAIATATGEVMAGAGDVERLIFPRSAIKSIQALAMFRSGATEKFPITDEMLALASASHRGEARHVEGVAKFLAMLGLGVADLECGAHAPGDPKAREALRARGEAPSALHNNCSGKHAGMLAVAKALGVPTRGYSEREHPVQQLVRASIADVTGAALAPDHCGMDGCSLPAWGMSLRALATGMARMATGQGLSVADARAAKRIVGAATAHPFLVSGTGRPDTELMAAFGDRLMLKGGAEGAYCGAFTDSGLGFALKIDDGRGEAAELLAASLVASTGKPDEKARQALAPRLRVVLRSWRGAEIGEMRATAMARPML